MPENVALSSGEWFIFFYVHSERALYELPFSFALKDLSEPSMSVMQQSVI